MSTPYHWYDDPSAVLRDGSSASPSLAEAVATMAVQLVTARPQDNPQYILPLTAMVNGIHAIRTATYDCAPFKCAPGGEVVSEAIFTVEPFGIPQDVGANIAVANGDYTEYLHLRGAGDMITITPAADPYWMTFETFTVYQNTGTDLSVSDSGAIVSAAGGIFSVSLTVGYRASV